MMNSEQLEFLISQYLDGALSAAEQALLEQRLAADPSARQLLEEYRNLDRALKTSRDLPAVKWDRFAEAVSDAISVDTLVAAGSAEPAGASDDSLERSVVEYVDGELPREQLATLEQRIAEDPAVARLVMQHRALHTTLKHAWPVPPVDHEELGDVLREAVEEEAQRSRYRIATYLRRASYAAIAACALIIMGIAAFMARDPGSGKGTLVVNPPPAAGSMQIVLGGPQRADGSAVVEIRLSEPEEFASTGMNPYVAEALVRPRRQYSAATPAVSPVGDPSLPW